MTTVLAKLTRSGGGYIQLDALAPGPSGGAYAVGNDLAGTVCVARLNSDGTLNWAKDITIPTLTPAYCAAASSSNRLAIVASSGDTFSAKTCIMMLDDTGSLVWESVLNNFCGPLQQEGVLIGSDNSVYIIGMYDGPLGSSQYDAVLLKLNPTTGAISWQVGLTPTGTTEFTASDRFFGSMAQLSGGDIVLTVYGGSGSNVFMSNRDHVQRVSSSDGSIVWTRQVDFKTGISSAAVRLSLGIDASDNIYVAGQGYAYGGSGVEYPLAKLASDGSTTWLRNVRRPSGAYTPVFDWTPGGLTADSSGVQVAGNMLAGTYGHLRVDAAGTIAGTAPLSYYTPEFTYIFGVRAPQIGSTVLFGWTDADEVTFTDYCLMVGLSQAGSGDDGTYGVIPRATVNFTVVNGLDTSVSTPGSWTRPSAPSLSLATDLGVSVGTGTLISSVTPPAITCAATSLGPTTQFGPDAYLRGLTVTSAPSTTFGANIVISRSFPNVGLTPPSTTFGTAVARLQQRPTALGPTANFGTPAYEPNTTRAADTLGVVLAGIGVPFATLGIAPQPPGYASSVEPTTTFGTPAAHQGISLAATGTLVTQFGTASARYTLAATALEPGAQFGTAKVTMARAASGFRVTQLGTPAVGLYGLPAGFLRTQFGTPSTRAARTCQATGFLVTNMGSGAAGGAWNLRTRSAYFRTRFGTPQAERTAP